jgi:hypothetical protein
VFGVLYIACTSLYQSFHICTYSNANELTLVV